MQILQTLLEISIYAAILFIATVLIKRIFRDKLSPFLHYAIWSLFLLRLLIPVTIASPVQLITLPATEAAASAPAAMQQSDPVSAEPDTQTVSSDSISPETTATHAKQTAPAQIGTFVAASDPKITFSTVILIVWLGGVAVGIGYLALLYILLQIRIGKNGAMPAKRLRVLYRAVRRELGIRKNVPLVCQYGLVSPGILFPARILMPMETISCMDDQQLKNTLRHELVHYKRGDHILSILLSLLNAVYWFNPVVWVAVPLIRADMETACDSVVVQQMSARQKGDYANLVLDLFSRSNNRKLVLGLSYGKSKSAIEQRIKGVFMKNQCNFSAKILCFALAFLLLIGCFTTACVPTKQAAIATEANAQNDTAISNDATANLEGQDATVQPTPTPAPAVVSPLAQKLGVNTPWRFAEWSTDHELQVYANLNVTLPNVDAVPIANVTCRNITMDDLTTAITAFLGQYASFVYAREDTKEYAEDSLPLFQEIYQNILDGTCPNKDPNYEKLIKQRLDTLQEMIQTAPSAAEKKPVSVGFRALINEEGNSYMGFRGVAEKDGTTYLVRANFSDRTSSININELYDDRPLSYLGSYRSEPEGISTTKEQAISLATELAQTLDSGLALSHVMAVGLFVQSGEENTWEHPWAWQCVFMREVNGVGTVYDSRDVASDMETNVQNGRAYEALEITVDDRGVCGVHWVNPVTVDSITNPNATLLSFAQIEALLPDLLREKYDYDITRENDSTHALYIQRAELGMMRIGKPGSTSYTMEPVWSFFIDFNEHPDYAAIPDLLRALYDGDPVYWNSLTISAIDGRVIDRDRGY